VSTEKKTEDPTYTKDTIKLESLTVDKTVQRTFMNIGKINQIIREYNEDAVGEITVSDRGHGERIVLDGMHRVEALRRMGIETVDAKVFYNLPKATEAQIFLDLNFSNQPSLFDKYRVGVTGENEEFVEVDRIVHAAGFTMGPEGTEGTINAVASVLRVHRLKYGWETEDEPADHSILQVTLACIADAWGMSESGLKASNLEAVGRLIQRFSPTLELDRLTETMAKTEGGAAGLLGRGRGYASMRTIRQWQAVGQILVDEYNKNLPTRSSRRLSTFAPR
jgi:uncharacterized ParB-like nuclease family protein